MDAASPTQTCQGSKPLCPSASGDLGKLPGTSLPAPKAGHWGPGSLRGLARGLEKPPVASASTDPHEPAGVSVHCPPDLWQRAGHRVGRPAPQWVTQQTLVSLWVTKTRDICARGHTAGAPPYVPAPSSLCDEATSLGAVTCCPQRSASPSSALLGPPQGVGPPGFCLVPHRGGGGLTKRHREPPAQCWVGGAAQQACPPLPLPLPWTRTPLPMCQESGG